MGLDDYLNGDDSKNSSSDSDSSSDDSSSADANMVTQTNKIVENGGGEDTFPSDLTPGYDPSDEASIRMHPMEREGAMSEFTTAELAKTADGTITRDEDQIKFHLPVFPIIETEDKYEAGNHYQLEYEEGYTGAMWNGRVVTCIGTVETQLGKINKEVVMFHAGSADKEQVMERTKERLGDDIDGETDVYISLFGDAMYMRDLAQANQQYRAGSRLNIDDVSGRVLNKNILHLAVTDPDDNE